MKIWLPYIAGGSGTDVFSKILAKGLRSRGADVEIREFRHHWQYEPWVLRNIRAPAGTDIVLANTWNAFAFRRPETRLVAIEHLFVLDPALTPYKSVAQSIFHRSFVRRFEIATTKAADQVVAVSDYAATAYARNLGTEKPCVIFNGVDTKLFRPLEGEDINSGKRPFRLLFVGNMIRRKGADVLPEIMMRLGPDFELSYTAGLRVKDPFPQLNSARKLGRMDHQALRNEYTRADALVFPTRLEGFGYAAAEAMACGTPVVATRGSSLPEIVVDGKTGLLCQQDDPEAFASAIRALASDETLRAKMSVASRRRAIEEFSLDVMLTRYMDLFAALMKK